MREQANCLLHVLRSIVFATVSIVILKGAVAQTEESSVSELEDFIVRATTKQRDASAALASGNVTAPFSRFIGNEINYVTVAMPSVYQKAITTDLRQFLAIAKIANLSVKWCEIRLDAIQSDLPECAVNNIADIVVAYPERGDSHAELEKQVSRLQFRDDRAAKRVANHLHKAIENAGKGTCLGGVVEAEGEIDAAVILQDDSIDKIHVRCSLFFSFRALGVRGVDLRSALFGESDEILTSPQLGKNAATALRFLYSKGIQAGMTNAAYVNEVRRWVNQSE